MVAPANVLVPQNLPEAVFATALAAHGATRAEARRVWGRVLRFRDMTGDLKETRQVRRPVLDAVQRVVQTPRLDIVERRADPTDGFTKYLFALSDGVRIESVRIPIFDTHYVACVSAQAGCPLGCTFCATARLGLQRNLRTWEMVEQVLAIRDEADRPVRGVVFMGMGEPFLNYDAVIAAAQVLSDPSGPAISAKAITVSTAGWTPNVERYTAEAHPYRLAVSLTSAIPEKRALVMPIEERFPVHDLMRAVRAHALARRTRAMLAYVMIRGFNTGREDALALKALIGDTPVKLDLIDVNDATGRFLAPTPEELSDFRDHLRILNAPIARRYSGGRCVEAACGMLAGA